VSFISSILLLAALGCGVFVPMIIGHALGAHEYGKLIWVPVYLVLAGVFGFLHARFGGSGHPSDQHH
jgi:hypothetical protein